MRVVAKAFTKEGFKAGMEVIADGAKVVTSTRIELEKGKWNFNNILPAL